MNHITSFLAVVMLLTGLTALAAAQDEGAENMGMPQPAAGSGEHPIGGVEILYADQAQTQEFYSTVFGWTFQPFEDNYFFFTAPAGMGGGFNGNKPEEPLNCIPFLYTPDVAATLEQVKDSGGSVVMDKQVVDPESRAGFAFIKDPAGVTMSIIDMQMPVDYAPDPFGDTSALVPGSIVSMEFYGGDLEVTGRFYKDIFGWESLSGMPQYLLFSTGKGISGVFQNHTPDLKVMVYIWVADVAAALDAIEAAGGKRLGGVMSMEGMPNFGYFTDPSGNSIGLMGPAS